MGVRFHIEYKDAAKEDTWIDVAGHFTFKDYWEPGISKLNLRWLELMGSAGIPLLSHMDDLSEIIEEFTQLQAYFSNNASSISESMRTVLVERLNVIIPYLRFVQSNSEDIASAYIG